MRLQRTPPFTLLAGLSASVALNTGCAGNEDDTRENKGTIVIKGFFDMTGATKDVARSHAFGVWDYINDINENGGIEGYLLDYDHQDNYYDMDRAREIYAAWKAEDDWGRVATIFGNGTHTSADLRDDVTADEKPLLTNSYATQLSTPVPVQHDIALPNGEMLHVDVPGAPYIFHPATDYSTAIRLALRWMYERGVAKVAFALDEECTYCGAPVPAGKSYCNDIGLEVLDDIHPPQAPSSYVDVEAVVKAYFADDPNGAKTGLEWFWVGNTTRSTSYFARAVAQHGPPGIRVMSNLWGFDENAYGFCGEGLAAGAANPCVERLYGTMSFAPYGDASRVGTARVVEIHDRWREVAGDDLSTYTDVRYVQGHVTFLMWLFAVKRVIAAGKEITGKAIKEALESFNAVSTGGLTEPLTITPTDHRPTNGARITTIDENGLLRFIDDVDIELKTEWAGW